MEECGYELDIRDSGPQGWSLKWDGRMEERGTVGACAVCFSGLTWVEGPKKSTRVLACRTLVSWSCGVLGPRAGSEERE